ncbi:unnamed protein product, partial [Gongylonema pulchrum]|uniref:Ig-like domain-containing protein n=1 Tax=Gongylonema pulchrum TaxID=637853 RepID=A0A183CYU9_9BILA
SYTVYFAPVERLTSDDTYKQWDKAIVRTTNISASVRLDKDTYNILPNRQYRVRVSATNDLSEGPASPSVIVNTGKTPPVIWLEPADNPATVPPRGSISVRCAASGIPEPSIIWIIGTNASDVIRGPILQLTDLRKDETATCKAENRAGQVQEVLQILVAGPGTPPNEIVALPLDNQQANVEWTTPDSPNGKITEYVIHYGEIPNGLYCRDLNDSCFPLEKISRAKRPYMIPRSTGRRNLKRKATVRYHSTEPVTPIPPNFSLSTLFLFVLFVFVISAVGAMHSII